ncbi:MAG TPA: hypothetical protein VF476_16420 [Chitinophagaceae bacterium]
MQKGILLVLLGLASFVLYAQETKEEMAKYIVGTWRFSNFWNPAGPTYAEYVADPCQNLTTYTFNEDGTATVQSEDPAKCSTATEKYVWRVIRLHDATGKERFGIRMMEELREERPNYDGNTWTDHILTITKTNKKVVNWVVKPQYSPASLEKISVYDRVKAKK